MLKVKKQSNPNEKYDEYEQLEKSKKQKYTNSKFKKKILKKKKFNKQSDYRNKAKRKK